MQAIILAGGRGTRLRPLTNKLPKPLVPIIDKPIIEHIIELLKRHGLTDIGITLGYLADKIVSHLGDGSRYGVRISYFFEHEPLGTAGSVKQAVSLLEDDFLVISGDSYTNIDLSEVLHYHKTHASLFTLVSKWVDDPTGMGVLKADGSGRVTSFAEKPDDVKGKALINTGIYVISRPIMSLVPNGYYDFGKDLLPKLIGNLYTYTTRDYWSDIGSLSSYYYTNYLVALREAP